MRKSVVQLFSGNLVSKLLGLVREVISAGLFGTGAAIGAYRVAQTGTLVPIHFLTSDSLNSAFVPQYRQLFLESENLAQTLFWTLAGLFGLLALGLGVCLWLLAPAWVGLLGPGLADGVSALAIDMLRIMAIGVPFYLLSSLIMFQASAREDFVPMAIRASMQNIGLIAGILLAFALRDPALLAWGFVGTYVFYSAWLLGRAWKARFLALPDVWIWPDVRLVLLAFGRTLRPLLLMPVFLQGNIAVERAVASLIGLVAVSGLDYARFIAESLIVLISMPVAFAGLSHWSGLSAEDMRHRLPKVATMVLLLGVPASLFLQAHAHGIIEAVYARGAFDARSVETTAAVLTGMAVGLWAQMLGYVLIKALNAQLRNAAVFRIMLAALLANAGFNMLCYPWFGAMTLGLGNSLYGMLLLIGTMGALGLWRETLRRSWVLAVAAAGYLGLNYVVPEVGGVWSGLAVAGAVSLLYWGIWFSMVPSLRRVIMEAILPLRRKWS